MKRLLLSIVFCLFCFNQSSQALVRMGFQAGGNLSSFKNEPSVDYTKRKGVVAGLLFEYGLLGGLSIQPEINYVQKGGFATGSEGAGISSLTATPPSGAKIRLNYLEIPIFLKAQASGFIVQPYLMAGPSLGIKIHSTLNGVGLDNVKSTDLSLVFGGGLEFRFGPMGVFASARYSMGLSNISEVGSYKTRGVHIVGGLMLGL